MGGTSQPIQRSKSQSKLPQEHFLSQRTLSDVNKFDSSTLAAVDFDVDPRSAFLPPDEPLQRLPGSFELWELALDAAQKLPLLLDGANNEVSNPWRNAICGVSGECIQRCILTQHRCKSSKPLLSP